MRPQTNLVKTVFLNSKSLFLMVAFMMLLTIACTPSYASTYPGTVENDAAAGASQVKDSKEPTMDARQVDPSRTYQWNGKVLVSELEGRHFELVRECDTWALLTKSEEMAKKLENNIGKKVVIWGKVHTEPTILMRPTIMVDAVYGENDPMPMTLVAIPEYPCKDRPNPVPPVPPVDRNLIKIGFSDLAARGELVWENGKAYLVTPQGRIMLTMPENGAPGQAPSADGSNSNAGKMDVVAAGKWKLPPLSIAAHTVRSWPVGVVTGVTCFGGVSAERLQEGDAAARGTLVYDANQPYLKTESGAIMLSFAANDLTTATTARARVLNDAVVVGKWRANESVLHMSVRSVGNMQPECRPTPTPPPSRPMLLQGEIASIGTLVWDNGRPYIETPSGKIYLKLAVEHEPSAAAELRGPEPADQTRPAPARPQVLVVGKWEISGGELVISVRHMQRWPYRAGMISPYPVAEPKPIDPRPVTPVPVTPGARDAGTLVGWVNIGPLCPVEPCNREIKDLYSSRAVVLQAEGGAKIEQKLNSDGSFKIMLKPSVYVVNITNCEFMGCKTALPQKVEIKAGAVSEMKIEIDTGIR